jgi:tetratricopeptide (TPR) repeat protein
MGELSHDKELYYKGKEALIQMNFEEASRLFINSIREEKCGKSKEYLLYSYLLQSDYKSLSNCFNNLFKLEPISGFSLYSLYWYKFMTGDLFDLQEILYKMLNENNYFLRAFAVKELYKAGKITNKQDLVQQKIKYFGLSYELDLEEKRASICIDYLYERYHLAILQGKTMMKEYPKIGDVYLDFVEIIFKIGNSSAIHEILNNETILKHAQIDVRLLYLLGRELYQLKEYDKSKDYMIRLAGIFKHNPLFHYNLGNIYSAKKNLVKAISEYEEAISVFPLFERAYYNAGIAYFKLGDINKAIKCFEEAVKIGKKPDAIYNLSISLIEKKELQDAFYYLNKIPSGYSAKKPPKFIKEQIKELIVFT